MRRTFFARVDLPFHGEKAFDDFMLGVSKYTHEHDSISGTQLAIKKLLSKAQDCYFHGHYLDGLQYYAQVLYADRKEISAWVGQIRILIDTGHYDGAIYWADKGCQLLDDARLISSAKAFALAYAGDVDDAKAIINVPVEKEEDAMLWLMRGEVLLKVRINLVQKLFTPYKGIGKLGAFFCFIKALSVDQQDPFINQRIGLAYLLAGDHRRAIEHLQTSLHSVRDNPLTLYGLAECHRRKREYEQSLKYVKKAIAGNPKLDSAFELLQWLHKPGRNFRQLLSC